MAKYLLPVLGSVILGFISFLLLTVWLIRSVGFDNYGSSRYTPTSSDKSMELMVFSVPFAVVLISSFVFGRKWQVAIISFLLYLILYFVLSGPSLPTQ